MARLDAIQGATSAAATAPTPSSGLKPPPRPRCRSATASAGASPAAVVLVRSAAPKTRPSRITRRHVLGVAQAFGHRLEARVGLDVCVVDDEAVDAGAPHHVQRLRPDGRLRVSGIDARRVLRDHVVVGGLVHAGPHRLGHGHGQCRNQADRVRDREEARAGFQPNLVTVSTSLKSSVQTGNWGSGASLCQPGRPGRSPRSPAPLDITTQSEGNLPAAACSEVTCVSARSEDSSESPAASPARTGARLTKRLEMLNSRTPPGRSLLMYSCSASRVSRWTGIASEPNASRTIRS